MREPPRKTLVTRGGSGGSGLVPKNVFKKALQMGTREVHISDAPRRCVTIHSGLPLFCELSALASTQTQGNRDEKRKRIEPRRMSSKCRYRKSTWAILACSLPISLPLSPSSTAMHTLHLTTCTRTYAQQGLAPAQTQLHRIFKNTSL